MGVTFNVYVATPYESIAFNVYVCVTELYESIIISIYVYVTAPYESIIISIYVYVAAPYESIDHDDYFSENDVDDDFEENYDIPDRVNSAHQQQEPLCRCKVLYEFVSSQSSELTIKEGKLYYICQP